MIATNKSYALPLALQNQIRITWNVSHWCNYDCSYCGVLVYSRRGPERQAHSFDYYPVADWIAAFQRIQKERVVLKVLGGEPFMDRANWKQLLQALLPDPRFAFDIFTNGSWNADYFKDLPNKEKAGLIVSFHSSKTAFEPWRERLLRIRDAGFTIHSVVTVLAPENEAEAERFHAVMSSDGFVAELRPMIPAGVYRDRKNAPPPLDCDFTPAVAWMQALRNKTKGLPCYFPSASYDLEWNGEIRVSCLNRPWTDFIREPLPETPPAAVNCPLDTCIGCMEMAYSMPANPFVPPPIHIVTRGEFAGEVRQVKAATAASPDYLQKTLTGTPMPDGVTDCYDAFTNRFIDEPPVQFDIPADRIFQALPDAPTIGYLDNFLTPLELRSSDRITVSGWAYNANPAGPVKQIQVNFAGQTLRTIEEFSPRPELLEVFGRKEMLRTGFGAILFIPPVPAGEYQLSAVAVDHQGNRHPLPPQSVRVIA